MIIRQTIFNLFIWISLSVAAVWAADETGGKNQPGQEAKDEGIKEQRVETTHVVEVNGQNLEYTAVAGTLLLKKDDGKPKASIFYIAYQKKDVDDASKRPVSFSFNGGPGSSSVWLHLGLLGPRRVKMQDNGEALPPPNELIPNEYTLLDLTDLVFIDPVSTGFSRPAPGEDAKQFHGFESDLESVGEFIRLYLTRHQRWASPKYVIGESYGTTRAAGLSNHLMDRYGLYLNGLILVSPILNFQTISFNQGNDLPYILFLPAYTATAWFHQRLPADAGSDLSALLADVEEFALKDYNPALMRGALLPPGERAEMVKKLARYTGLSETFIQLSDLRVPMARFAKELLRDRELTIGRFDSRLMGRDRDAAGEAYEYDPSYAAVLGPAAATLNHYLRAELKFESDLPYEILTSQVHPWKYNDFKQRYVDVSEWLRQALVKNPNLRVFAACGIYDLATPYFTAVYTFNHLGLDASLQKNITIAHYEAGHMMYFHRPSLVRLKDDLARFLVADPAAH